MEAMVAASLLVILALGFFTSIDGAAKSSASNRHRSVAAGLAETEMERLRAVKLYDPVDLTGTRTQRVGSVNYTIASSAVWVDDSAGATTCGAGSSGADYLKVSARVTWPTMGSVKPVASDSLFAVKPGQGSIKVKVVDGAGAGVQGVTAGLSGPRTSTGVTDVNGCLFYGFLPVGTYTAGLNMPGFVDKTGTQAVSQQATVGDTETASMIFQYAQASTLNVSFDTVIGGSTQSVTGTSFTVANSALPSPSTRAFSGASAATLSSGANLFPFSDGYAVYAGNCSPADPRAYSDPGGPAPVVTTTAGGSSSVTVRMPAFNILIVNGSNVPYPNADQDVTVKLTPPVGCGSTFVAPLTPAAILQKPALAYGDYDVCAEVRISGNWRTVSAIDVPNHTPAGSAVRQFQLSNASTAGRCP